MLVSRGGINCFLSHVLFASPPLQFVVYQGIVSSLKKWGAEDHQALSFAASRLVCRTMLPPFPMVLGREAAEGAACGPLEMPGPEPAHLPTPVTAHGQGIWEPHWSSAQGRGPSFTPGSSDPTPMSGRCHRRSVWAELCSSECWGPVSPAQQVLPSAGRRRMRFGFAWLIALPL